MPSWLRRHKPKTAECGPVRWVPVNEGSVLWDEAVKAGEHKRELPEGWHWHPAVIILDYPGTSHLQ